MSDGRAGRVEAAIDRMRAAFGRNVFPGDAFLQGSRDGCEPFDEVSPFFGKTDWAALDAEFLDVRAAALSFFSEAGFRFFLPAFLVVDLRGQLNFADPVFHLTSGFSDVSVEDRRDGRVFVLRTGKSTQVNPRRYGAMTFEDYARFRLSVFTREEADAIVDYLRCKLAADPGATAAAAIDRSLESFWLERSRAAPTAESLERHLAEQVAYVEAIRAGDGAR